MSLRQGTLTNLATTRAPQAALTGPIKRGDSQTVQQHVENLINQDIKQFYQAAGKLTLQLTEHESALLAKLSNALSQ